MPSTVEVIHCNACLKAMALVLAEELSQEAEEAAREEEAYRTEYGSRDDATASEGWC